MCNVSNNSGELTNLATFVQGCIEEGSHWEDDESQE